MCVAIQNEHEHDLSTLLQKHVKELYLGPTSVYEDPEGPLSASSEFPHCPQFTHFIVACCYDIDDSVPAAFMKAVGDGKFPKLRRIEVKGCTLPDCEWPEVPEFYCNSSTQQKHFFNLTELSFYGEHDIDRLISVRLEKLLALYLRDNNVHMLQRLNNVLKQGFLPNLSKLHVSIFPQGSSSLEHGTTEKRINTFLREFDRNNVTKLKDIKIPLSADDLKILVDKMSLLQLTGLDISGSFTGNLSVLFTHSLPTLATLILRHCDLNSDDLRSLAKAEAEGKLAQFKHLNI